MILILQFVLLMLQRHLQSFLLNPTQTPGWKEQSGKASGTVEFPLFGKILFSAFSHLIALAPCHRVASHIAATGGKSSDVQLCYSKHCKNVNVKV